ncbi:MAG: ABC transporter permease [Propionibacteriales bacterium]|nr:ABC transporter permease [Propionibacteriales bacterium]
MTVAPPSETLAPAAIAPPPRAARRGRIWLWLLSALVLVSLVRVLTGAHELTSSGTLRQALIAAIPIAMAGLGGLWSERTGIINIGLEGMMILGALGAGYFTYYYGIWIGLLGALLFGAIGGLIHALATVTFGVDHIVSGVAITIMATGVAAFLAEAYFSGLPGGGPTQSPTLDTPPTITVPGVSDWLLEVQSRHWFLVSDVASAMRALVWEMSVVTLLAVALVIGSGWLLWRTRFGLRLRSCGESPSAAETLGVNVYLYKFVAVTASGGFAGLGGAYLVLVASSGYQNGIVGGRGYIGLAANIFGNWRPGGLFMGSTLFGYTEGLHLRPGSGLSIHALLLLVAICLLVLAALQVRRAQMVPGAVSFVASVGFFAWFMLSDEIPADFTGMTPFVTTILVLALASQRLRVPATIGMSYRRGQAG